MCDAGCGWPRESLCRSQGSIAETLWRGRNCACRRLRATGSTRWEASLCCACTSRLIRRWSKCLNTILCRNSKLGVLKANAPDLTQPQSDEPVLALVFDREGWSPNCFRRLARRGIACITWHKNFKGADWPETDFDTFEVPIHGPAQVRMMSVALARKRSFCRIDSRFARFAAGSTAAAKWH